MSWCSHPAWWIRARLRAESQEPQGNFRLAQGSQVSRAPRNRTLYQGFVVKASLWKLSMMGGFHPPPPKTNQSKRRFTPENTFKEEKEKHRPKPTNFWVGFKCLSVRFRWCFSHSLLSKHPRAADLDSTNPPQDFPGWWFEIFFYCHPYWGKWWNLTNIFPTN